ncbi:MAG: DNA repair exonuclease [Pseudomonadota bacterium]
MADDDGKPLNIFHCSDIHLDDEARHAEALRAGFTAVLAKAREVEPDIVLIAGDLFDSNRIPDSTVAFAMEQIESVALPVALIPGNHDCMAPDGVFRRFDFDRLSNVEMLSEPNGELRTVTKLGVTLWGRGMVDHSIEYAPLGGAPPKPPDCRWYIGLAHGIYVPEGEDNYRSSPVPERAIAESPFDYLALGHHHAAMEVHAGNTAAVFSGSPTDKVGRGASYAVVRLPPAGPADVSIRVL